jgi:hypothetical protein
VSLQPIDPTALPAEIRSGSAQRRQTFEGAMAFERMLVEQLTKELAKTQAAGADSTDGEDGGDKGSFGGPYASMLPGAFADGIEAGGGLGLALQLTNSISPESKQQS